MFTLQLLILPFLRVAPPHHTHPFMSTQTHTQTPPTLLLDLARGRL